LLLFFIARGNASGADKEGSNAFDEHSGALSPITTVVHDEESQATTGSFVMKEQRCPTPIE
jgi:hypothetical protein